MLFHSGILMLRCQAYRWHSFLSPFYVVFHLISRKFEKKNVSHQQDGETSTVTNSHRLIFTVLLGAQFRFNVEKRRWMFVWANQRKRTASWHYVSETFSHSKDLYRINDELMQNFVGNCHKIPVFNFKCHEFEYFMQYYFMSAFFCRIPVIVRKYQSRYVYGIGESVTLKPVNRSIYPILSRLSHFRKRNTE